MPTRTDYAGERFERLLVLSENRYRHTAGGYKKLQWKCRCDCGSELFIDSDKLRAGNRISCGCAGRVDVLGQKFHRLTVTSYAGNGRWNCRCVCGNAQNATAWQLTNDKVKSCGCFQREVALTKHRTHGMSKTRAYGVWCAMLRRCYKPQNVKWKDYGERGIRVCDRWRDDFAAFLADMGERPTPRHSIDRINNDGHYEPGNCRWATPKEQANNQRGRQGSSGIGAMVISTMRPSLPRK